MRTPELAPPASCARGPPCARRTPRLAPRAPLARGYRAHEGTADQPAPHGLALASALLGFLANMAPTWLSEPSVRIRKSGKRSILEGTYDL